MKLKPVVAGQFYPKESQELLKQLKAFENKSLTALDRPVDGLVLPHAGYVYSGLVASWGYRSITTAPSTIVVVGPSHYLPFKGVSIFSGESVLTPLGEVRVDQEACDFLIRSNSHLADIPLAFAKEHSVEVHMPMIKHYFPQARVVPIVMGQGMEFSVIPLVKTLLELRKQKSFVLIASSDLSHYPSYEIALQADQAFLEALLSGHEAKVDEIDKKIMAKGYPDYYCTHCGKEPVLTLLRYAQARRVDDIRLLKYQNSGDVTGDYSRVVGYGAVAFCS